MLLKSKYTDDQIDFMYSRGEVACASNYGIEAVRQYQINNVKISERVFIDLETKMPWFANISYVDLPEKKRPEFSDAIEKAFTETNGTVFRASSELDPVMQVTLVTKHGKPAEDDKEKNQKLKIEEESIEKAVKQLERLEMIIQV